MKNNFNTTEESLMKGKRITLSVSEHDEIKSALLSYARYHGEKEKTSKNIFMTSSFLVRSFASATFALVLFVGTGYSSTSSLPGDFLYPVKTNVVEELISATKLTPLSQLEYHHERYETRLFELQTLSKDGQLSLAALQDSQVELLELSWEVEKLMNGEDEIEDAVALDLMGDMVAMSNATEELVRTNSSRNQLDAFEQVADELGQIHEDEITDFLTNSTSTIEVFIQEQLAEISEELAENDLEKIITVRVGDYVEDVEISLQKEDYLAVVSLVSDVLILIESNEYADDYQNEIAE